MFNKLLAITMLALLCANEATADLIQYRDNVGSAIIGTYPYPGDREFTVSKALYIDIDGTHYDFSMNSGSWDTNFDPYFFVGNKEAARSAAMETLWVVSSVTDSHLPWQVYYDADSFFAFLCGAGCFYLGDSDIDDVSSAASYRTTVGFRLSAGPVVAPIPPAVWLFGSALGLIGVMRRKVSG